MATPTCTVASLVTGSPCFKGTTIDDQQKLALMIWFAANELKALGGTDYTTSLVSTSSGGLLADEAAFRTLNNDEVSTALLTIYYNNAVASGATVSSNIQTLMGNIKCLILTDTDTMNRMLLLLLCKLGVHKTYPQ